MWCDASPSPLKIAELANPHDSSPSNTVKTADKCCLFVCATGSQAKNTVRTRELPMFQQKQGLQPHDDSTRTGRRSSRKGQGRLALEQRMTAMFARAGVMCATSSVDWQARDSCSAGQSYRPLKHAVELAAVVELLGRVNLARA